MGGWINRQGSGRAGRWEGRSRCVHKDENEGVERRREYMRGPFQLSVRMRVARADSALLLAIVTVTNEEVRVSVLFLREKFSLLDYLMFLPGSHIVKLRGEKEREAQHLVMQCKVPDADSTSVFEPERSYHLSCPPHSFHYLSSPDTLSSS